LWRKNRRDAPDLFQQELEATMDRIRLSPGLGLVYEQTVIPVAVHRIVMPRTRNHVCYAVDGDELIVMAVWGARKEHGPILGPFHR
jgi:hypothetical protein